MIHYSDEIQSMADLSRRDLQNAMAEANREMSASVDSIHLQRILAALPAIHAQYCALRAAAEISRKNPRK